MVVVTVIFIVIPLVPLTILLLSCRRGIGHWHHIVVIVVLLMLGGWWCRRACMHAVVRVVGGGVGDGCCCCCHLHGGGGGGGGMVAVVVIYHCHYQCLSLWLVAWRVSACVKLEIKIVRTHLCGMTHTSCRAYTMSPMVDSM